MTNDTTTGAAGDDETGVAIGPGGSYHGGVRANRDIVVGGDLDASSTHYSVHQPVVAVAADGRAAVDQLVRELQASALWQDAEVRKAAADLAVEVGGTVARPQRLRQLLTAVETAAVRVTVVLAAVETARRAFDL